MSVVDIYSLEAIKHLAKANVSPFWICYSQSRSHLSKQKKNAEKVRRVMKAHQISQES